MKEKYSKPKVYPYDFYTARCDSRKAWLQLCALIKKELIWLFGLGGQK